MALELWLSDDAKFEIKTVQFDPAALLIIFSHENSGAAKTGGKEVGAIELASVFLRNLIEPLVVRSRKSSAGYTNFQ